MTSSMATNLASAICLLTVFLQGCIGVTDVTTTTTTSISNSTSNQTSNTTATTTWTSTTQAPHVFQTAQAIVTIPEDVAIGTTVFLAATTAADPQVFSLHGESNTSFSIGIDGMVSVASPLDCEAKSVHVLPITSVVSGDVFSSTATSTLTVSVSDVNDNRPVFNSSVYNVSAPSGIAGFNILYVKATDADCSPANNAISYTLAPNPLGLTINTDNGGVALPLEAVTGFFEGVVVASDPGGLDATAGIAVTVYSDCGVVPTIANGTVTLNGTSTSYGANASLTCVRGFNARPPLLKCNVHGLWQPDNATCELVLCPDLQSPLNGTVQYDANTVDTVATFGCDAGFDLQGNETLMCRMNGNWSAPPPICQIKDCGYPRGIVNGTVTTSNTTFGSTAVYACNTGYQINGDNTSLCLYNGTWEAVAPTCTLQDCGYPTPLGYDGVSFSNIANLPTYGSRAVFRCSPGYMLSHNDSLICTETGAWNGSAPSCDIGDCGELQAPSDGSVSYTNNETTFGSYATFSCDPGYDLSQTDTLLCYVAGLSGDVAWDGSPPSCIIKDCGILLTPSDGSVSYTNNATTFGSAATFSCDPGYDLSHTDTLTCAVDATLLNVSWSGSAPSCDIKDCGIIVSPTDGSVSYTNNATTYGSDATFSCNPGYDLSHTDTLTCTATGNWNGAAPTCDIKDCGDIVSPTDGSVSYTNNATTYGSDATFTCDPGYDLSHTDTLTCTGNWNGTVPTCDIKDCGTLAPPSQGSMSYTGNGTTYGAVAAFSCEPGYTLSHTDALICTDTGSWNGSAPTCDINDCGTIQSPSDGSVSYTNNVTTFESNATFSCNTGYELSHTDTLTCTVSGDWSGSAPTCDIKDCGTLTPPSQGSVSYTGNVTTYGAVAAFSCKPGYTPSNTDVLICTDTGTWNGSAPSCDIKDCGTIQSPSDGSVSYTNSMTTFESNATFSCNTGYELSHTDTLTCTVSGDWSGSAPTCDIKDCGNLSPPSQGSVSYTGNVTTYGAVAAFSCEPGYTLSHTDALICTDTGSWNGSAPTCDIKDCGTIDTPDNGFFAYSNNVTTFGATATFGCNQGYTLSHNNAIQCSSQGGWNGTAPTCDIKDCGQLTAPDQGSVSYAGNVTTFDSVATYACAEGYSLSPDVTRLCKADGAWDGSDPTCEINECERLPAPSEGTVTYQNNVTTYGTSATFFCNMGYALSHQHPLYCTATGSWNRTAPTCDIEDCGAITAPSQGSVIYDTANITTYGATVTFDCDSGYSLSHTDLVMCKANGEWNGTAPVCNIKDCQTLTDPDHGTISYANDVTTFGSTATVTCNMGYEASHTDLLYCTADGTWNGTVPQCTIKDCGAITAPSQGSVIYGTADVTTYGATVTFDCDSGYSLSHTDLVMCKANGEWNGTAPVCNIKGYGLSHSNSRVCTGDGTWNGTSPECIANACSRLPAPAQGSVSFTNNVTTYGSQGSFACSPGYTLSHGRVLVCTANGSWSDIAPTCNIIDCGDLSAPTNGALDASGGSTFGATVRYSCNTGFKLYGDIERACLASGAWGGVTATCVLERQPVTPCRATQDDRGTTWAEALPNQIRVAECPLGFTGNATRKCNAKGNWEPPLYNCERQKVKNVKAKAAALNPSSTQDEVQDVLQNIVELTNETTAADVAANDKLTHAELDSVATSFQEVADSLDETKLDDTIEEDFFEAASQMIDTPNRDTWKTLGDSGGEGAEKVIKAVDTMTGIVTEKFRAFGNTSKIIARKNIVVEVRKVHNGDVNFPDPSASLVDWQDSNTRAFLPNSAIQGNNVVATGVIFRNMSEITSAEQSSANASAKEINGPVVAITIRPAPADRLDPPLRLTFEHSVAGLDAPSCSFWEETGNKWSTSGCSVVASNNTMTVCECNHLTNFAVLMSPFVEADAESTALRIVSIVGIGISIVCIILTLAVHFYLWRYLRSDRTTILMHLCVALLVSYVLFLAGVDRTESREFCAVVAVLLQYIYLVVFCVMLAEGIEIGISLLFVFVKRSRIKLLMTAAWVLPAIIVSISLGVTKAEGYGNENFCWLSVDSGLIWAFVGPALAIILFNLVCLCIIIKVMFSTKAMEQKKKIKKVKAGVRSLGILIPLMGVTWIIGIFYINEDFYWIQYVFAICNGLQGFFIFLFHCLLNQQIRNARAAQKRRKSSTSMKSTMRATAKSDSRTTKEYSSNDMSNTYLGKSNNSDDKKKYKGSSGQKYLAHSLSEEDEDRFTPPLGVANGANLRLNMNTFSSNM